jgi:cytochrome c peroxidase
MRTIKLSIVSLFSLLLILAFGAKLFRGFVATGQVTTLAAPTEVIASDNAYSTKVGIAWDTIRGATLYRVFRNTSNDSGSAISVGATAEGTFFDNTAVVGQNYFYWVRAENGNVVSSLSDPDQGTRANGVINGPVAPLNPPPAPPGNPITATKAYLGKTLFWDEQLSSTRTVACGTCHFSTNGGSDSRAIVNNLRSRNPGADGVFSTPDDVFASPGVVSNNLDGTYNWSPFYGFREQVTGRKSRSYIDAGYSNSLFWDGRATQVFTDPISGAVGLVNGAALESQVLGPPVSSAEMAHTGRNWNDVAARVAFSKPLALSPTIPAGLSAWLGGRSYAELFNEAFGTPDVTPARIAMAIATYERTLYSDRTPFDQSVAQITTLTPAETRGQGVFNQSRCNVCHAGTLFSDNQFHNIGVRPQTEDTGRFQVTGNANNIGEFRTPSLRNAGLRGPYFHDGHFATLEEVVAFYNRGGDFNAPNIDHNLIRPLGLSPQQQSDLVSFLRGALTDARVTTGTTPFDRPILYTESNRVPQITGSGTPGAGGNIPQVTAIEPPLVGNPGFTVGVSNALGDAPAVLVIGSTDPGTGPSVPATGSLARVGVRLSGSGAGQGFGSVSLLIPDNLALIGSTFFGRWFVSDPNATGGVAVTPAFRMTIFGDAASIGPNPIDDTSTFVTQHYKDFLNRAPDPPGFAGWTATINNCAGDTTQCDRVHVSEAFFKSEEFQQRGYFIYRFYSASFGRKPDYAEFVPDLARVSGFLDSNQLEAAKVAFIADFMSRSAFVAKYNSLTNQQFVDALLATAAVTSSNKQTLIDGLNSGTLTRAAVLRQIVESIETYQKYYNQAFVVMQYFGYLRRDPDALYLNWIQVLDANPADSRHMITGFVNSAEYRQRFGP